MTLILVGAAILAGLWLTWFVAIEASQPLLAGAIALVVCWIFAALFTTDPDEE